MEVETFDLMLGAMSSLAAHLLSSMGAQAGLAPADLRGLDLARRSLGASSLGRGLGGSPQDSAFWRGRCAGGNLYDRLSAIAHQMRALHYGLFAGGSGGLIGRTFTFHPGFSASSVLSNSALKTPGWAEASYSDET